MNKENVEAIYPVPAAHQPMLFHAIRGGADRGFLHYGCVIDGAFDPDAFRGAFEHVVARHAALRTSFHWEGLDQPLAVVLKQASLPVDVLDWRDRPVAEHAGALDAFLADDKARGFDLTKAPLMRLTLIRLSETAWQEIWSLHHLLVDGWSAFLVLGELFAAYDRLAHGEALEDAPARPYRDYVQWLGRRDPTAAEAWWRDALAGVTEPTPIDAIAGPARPTDDVRPERLDVAAATTDALEALAKREQLTLSTICATAWAHVLASYAGRDDVVFGTTVSGRPADLPGVERMVGAFTNTVPVRIALDRAEALASGLRRVRDDQLAMREHEWLPIAEIQAASEIPARHAPFDTLYLYQNYPWDGSLSDLVRDCDVRDFRWDNTTDVPLTVVALRDATLELWVHHDANRITDDAARAILADWAATLDAIASGASTLAALPTATRGPAAGKPAAGATAEPSEPAAPAPGDAFVEPRTDAERLVAELWRDTLGVDDVSIHDNFFDLGGSSVLLMKAVTQLEKVHGFKLNPWEMVFQSLEQVATVCDERMKAVAASGGPPKRGLAGRLFGRKRKS